MNGVTQVQKFKAMIRDAMRSDGVTRVTLRHVTLTVDIIDNGADYATHHTARYAVVACARPSGSVYRNEVRPTFDAAYEYYRAITHGNTFGPRIDYEYHRR